MRAYQSHLGITFNVGFEPIEILFVKVFFIGGNRQAVILIRIDYESCGYALALKDYIQLFAVNNGYVLILLSAND